MTRISVTVKDIAQLEGITLPSAKNKLCELKGSRKKLDIVDYLRMVFGKEFKTRQELLQYLDLIGYN